VGEYLRPHVENETFADLRRYIPLGETEAGIKDCETGNEDCEEFDETDVLAEDALIDDLPEDQGVDDSDHGVCDHEDHEDGEDPPVRRGELGYALECSRRDIHARNRVVAPERAHMHSVHSPAARTHELPP
jgi:hypothetical protein